MSSDATAETEGSGKACALFRHPQDRLKRTPVRGRRRRCDERVAIDLGKGEG